MSNMKRTVCTAIAALSLMGVAACSGEKADRAEAPVTTTEIQSTRSLTVTDPRLVLAPVAGNPAAVYFDLSYAGDAGLTLASVAVDGAGMSMIHQTVEKDGAMSMMDADPIALETGTPVSFAPGGMHVMAMQPSDAWKPGGSVKVTLTLSDGTTHSFDAPVRAAGEDR